MAIVSEYNELKKLKTELESVRRRISVTKSTLDAEKHIASPTLLGLYKREGELVKQINEFPSPPDFTPSPSGCAPVPAAALAYA